MANHRQANVIFVDTTEDFLDVRYVRAVKYIGAAASTAKIVADGSGGDDLWEENATTNSYDEVFIRNSKGIRVEITGTAKVYLYV